MCLFPPCVLCLLFACVIFKSLRHAADLFLFLFEISRAQVRPLGQGWSDARALMTGYILHVTGHRFGVLGGLQGEPGGARGLGVGPRGVPGGSREVPGGVWRPT